MPAGANSSMIPYLKKKKKKNPFKKRAGGVAQGVALSSNLSTAKPKTNKKRNRAQMGSARVLRKSLHEGVSFTKS
jgi:hypothetical protein